MPHPLDYETPPTRKRRRLWIAGIAVISAAVILGFILLRPKPQPVIQPSMTIIRQRAIMIDRYDPFKATDDNPVVKNAPWYKADVSNPDPTTTPSTEFSPERFPN